MRFLKCKIRKIINHEVDFSEPFDKISVSGLALGMLLNILGFDYFYCHLISSIKFNLSNIFKCLSRGRFPSVNRILFFIFALKNLVESKVI